MKAGLMKNPNENSQQFWQSRADQESPYYPGLFFQTNQPNTPLGNNAYDNQPQSIGNLYNKNPAQDYMSPAYNAQQNRDNVLPFETQVNFLPIQIETNLPAAAESLHQHREISIPLSNYRTNLNTWTLPDDQLIANTNALPIVPHDIFNARIPASVNTVGGTTNYHNPVTSSAILDNQASHAAPLMPVCPIVSSSLPYYGNGTTGLANIEVRLIRKYELMTWS